MQRPATTASVTAVTVAVTDWAIGRIATLRSVWFRIDFGRQLQMRPRCQGEEGTPSAGSGGERASALEHYGC